VGRLHDQTGYVLRLNRELTLQLGRVHLAGYGTT
jgi:hypothetical protein